MSLCDSCKHLKHRAQNEIIMSAKGSRCGKGRFGWGTEFTRDLSQLDNCKYYELIAGAPKYTEPPNVFRWVCEDEYDGQPELSPGSCGVLATQREREPTIPFTHDDKSDGQPEPVRFTKTIPTEPGFYWVDPGEGVSESPHTNDYEIVKIDPSTRYGDRMFTFSHKVDFLDLSEIQNEFLKEDKGLFGPKIEPPTELVSTATEWKPK